MRFLPRAPPDPTDSTTRTSTTNLAAATPAPPAPDLLAFLSARAADYRLWALEEVDRDDTLPRGGGVVGALSLATWRPLLPALRASAATVAAAATAGGVGERERDRGGEDEMLVFVMTLADGAAASAEVEAEGADGRGVVVSPSQEQDGGGDFRLLILHRKGKERGQRGSYMEIPGRVRQLMLRTLSDAAADYAKARIWGRVRACLAEKPPDPPMGAAAAASSADVASSPLPAAPVPLAAPTPLHTAARAGPGAVALAPQATTAQEDVSALAHALPPAAPPHAPFRAQELAALLRFSSATPLAALDGALAPLFGDGGGTGEEQQQQQLQGLPWLDVLAHLERGFWRRTVAVEGLRASPGEADLLISCHLDTAAAAGAAGHAGARRASPSAAAMALPPLPRVLLHLSVRPPEASSEGADETGAMMMASPSSLPSERPRSAVRAQLLVRTGRGEESERAAASLAAGERQVVERVIEKVVGVLWFRVLAHAPRGPGGAAMAPGGSSSFSGSFFSSGGGGGGGGGPPPRASSARSHSAARFVG